MSENKDNKLTLINEKTANDYLTHTMRFIFLKRKESSSTIHIEDRLVLSAFFIELKC